MESRPRSLTTESPDRTPDMQRLLDAMPVGVLLVGADGRVHRANKQALQLLGYTQQELTGLDVDTLVPEPSRSLHRDHRNAYAAEPTQRPMGFRRDLYAQRRDGTTFPVEIGLSPLEYKGEIATLCTIVDITDRKRQEAERESLVFELETRNAAVGSMYRVSELTRAVAPSESALREIAEATREGLLGAPVAGVRITVDGTAYEDSEFHASDDAIGVELSVDGRQRGKVEAFLAGDGSSGDPDMRDERFGTLVNAVADALSESLERTDALTKVVRASQLASIGELAAGVGHEVNNPINGIINCVDILLRNAPEGTKDRQYSELIKQEAYRIASIVGSLLAFARSGQSKATSTSFATVLENVLTLCRKRFEKFHVQLTVDTEGNLPPIGCEPEQMQQVLLNLVLNAVYALDERYPEADPNKCMIISARHVSLKSVPHVEIVVEDHGIGIRPEHRDRVFDPFFSTKGPKGTGLGLSVSLNIVYSHGGWIEVESEDGKATRFIVRFPVYEPEDTST